MLDLELAVSSEEIESEMSSGPLPDTAQNSTEDNKQQRRGSIILAATNCLHIWNVLGDHCLHAGAVQVWPVRRPDERNRLRTDRGAE